MSFDFEKLFGGEFEEASKHAKVRFELLSLL